MTSAYATTSVPVERSKTAIRDLLLKNKARGVQFSEDFHDHRILLRFAMEVEGTLRTVNVSLTVATPPEPKRKRRPYTRYNFRTGRRTEVGGSKREGERWEQSERATYRALHYWLKSSFEAVEFGLFSMTDMFLSHFEWMVNGKQTTVGALVKPNLQTGNLLMAPLNTVEGEIVSDQPRSAARKAK